MVLAQLFEKSIILKYSAEPMGATTYLKMLYFPTTYTIPHDSICGLGYKLDTYPSMINFSNFVIMDSYYFNTRVATLNISQRFRKFLPVVIDVETAGFNASTDALLEIAACIIRVDEKGIFYPDITSSFHVDPFEGANLEEEALKFNGIDPFNPLRGALPEREALEQLFKPIRKEIRETGCNRAVLIGHNAAFDLNFLNAAVQRSGVKRNPFHPFSTLDTVTLSALAFGQTVLAKAIIAAEIEWDPKEAHSAAYDTAKTAELFCYIFNKIPAIQLFATLPVSSKD